VCVAGRDFVYISWGVRVEQKCGPLYYYCSTPWWRLQKVETKGGRWKSRKDEGRKIAGRKILKGEGHVVNYLEEFQQIYKEILKSRTKP
jgi:hypothetical protein